MLNFVAPDRQTLEMTVSRSYLAQYVTAVIILIQLMYTLVHRALWIQHRSA